MIPLAERRMFSKKITNSDDFLDMSVSAQNLYFHLNQNADDDGFNGSPRSVMRQCRATDDDMRLLIAKKFVIAFDCGVVVIRHWRIHNTIRKDRYTATLYQDLMAQIYLHDGEYDRVPPEEENYDLPPGNQTATKRQPDGNQVATQVRLGKDRLGKDRLEDNTSILSSSRASDDPDIDELEQRIMSGSCTPEDLAAYRARFSTGNGGT